MHRMMRCLSRCTSQHCSLPAISPLDGPRGSPARQSSLNEGDRWNAHMPGLRWARSRALASNRDMVRRGLSPGKAVWTALYFVNDHLIVRPIPSMLEAPRRAQGAALRWPTSRPAGRISPYARAGSDCAQAPIHLHGPRLVILILGTIAVLKTPTDIFPAIGISGRQRDLDLRRPRAGRYVGTRRLSLRTGADHARQRYRTYRIAELF